jgi:hypothetical protein
MGLRDAFRNKPTEAEALAAKRVRLMVEAAEKGEKNVAELLGEEDEGLHEKVASVRRSADGFFEQYEKHQWHHLQLFYELAELSLQDATKYLKESGLSERLDAAAETEEE